ncbi:hypothetical protein RM555_01530 [Micromonospora sp. DSM 115977]|uniref:Uncharacterized protein n=1 Tax=Micromonospora reichwaldensis TaxID=3075516 RepID=A0ABU2WPV2_9ACTN|nr:hypothetical protein [Micromonospora sp. DSM 115977]MDT0527664.1 hypothetical protein [Micromonospora sp. DSM 115977]
MNTLTRLINRFRRPLRIQLVGPADQTAAALHGLAQMVNRRRDMNDRRIRIDVTIREKPLEEWR